MMKSQFRNVLSATLALLLAPLARAASAPSHPNTYIITNNDGPQDNTANLYVPRGNTLVEKQVFSTFGDGIGEIGSVATKRLTVLHGNEQSCLFLADAGSSDIARIDLRSRLVSGLVKGSPTDDSS